MRVKPIDVKNFFKGHFAVTLTTAFVVCELIVIRFHEMWRDELQAWVIAQNSTSISNLFHNLRYEGHPALWHILLFVLTRFTSNPFAMQLLHVVIASITVYLIARYAPFTKLQKVLLSFSYMFFYEYGIMSRNYSLGVLFIILFCVLMSRVRKNYWLLAACLFLLSQTNAMGALLVPVLTGYMIWDYVTSHNVRNWREFVRTDYLVAVVAAFVGLVVFYVQVRLPADSYIVGAGYKNMPSVIATMWQSFAPIPARTVGFWNTNILKPDEVLAGSLVVIVALTLMFSRHIKMLITLFAGSTIIAAFFYFKYGGGLRHQGYLFVLFIACVWLMRVSANKETKEQKNRRYVFFQEAVLITVLALQVIGCAAAVYKDVKLPFSRAKATASYIHQNKLDRLPMAAEVDYVATPVSGYLGKKIYFTQVHQWGSFVIWNRERIIPITEPDLIASTKALARQRHSPVLLLAVHPIDTSLYSGVTAKAHFDQTAVMQDEIYYLYIVSPS